MTEEAKSLKRDGHLFLPPSNVAIPDQVGKMIII